MFFFMIEKRQYLREWRKHRGLTQEQVIDRLAVLDDSQIPQTGASLSRLENGKQPYSERVLEALADIYQCAAWELIGRDPTKEGKVIDMVRALDERQQAQLMAIMAAIDSGNGTTG